MDALTLLPELDAHPAPPTREATDRAYARLSEAMSAATLSSGTHVASRRRRHGRGRRRVIGGVVVASAAFGLTAALVLSDLVGFAGLRPGATAQAAEVLDTAADSIRTSGPVVRPGQYLQIRTTNLSIHIVTAANTTRETSWLDRGHDILYIPADDRQRWVWKRGEQQPAVFFGPESRKWAEVNQRQAAADPHPDHVSTGLLSAPNGAFYGKTAEFTPSTIKDLPRDPRVLLNHIYRVTLGQGTGPDQEAMVWIADLLRTGFVPADLRASLYRAAAMIPGVTVTERSTNLDGETGVAIGRAGNDERQDIIIEPRTGRLIGERTINLRARNGMPVGAVTNLTAVKTSITDSAPSK